MSTGAIHPYSRCLQPQPELSRWNIHPRRFDWIADTEVGRSHGLSKAQLVGEKSDGLDRISRLYVIESSVKFRCISSIWCKFGGCLVWCVFVCVYVCVCV